MKKLLYVLGLSFVMACSVNVQAKVGVVNVAEVFQKMPEREQVSKKLESEFKGRLTELQKMEKELQDSVKKLQSGGKGMKAADRTKLENDIISKRGKFEEKAEAFERDNQRRQGEERAKILSKIQKAVENVAQKEKYTLIVDANAVAFAEASIDVTDKVLVQVKK